MEKHITREQLERLAAAKKEVSKYVIDNPNRKRELMKYDMVRSFKNDYGAWQYFGTGIPSVLDICTIKTVRGKTYIYTSDVRYMLKKEVCELLGIEVLL